LALFSLSFTSDPHFAEHQVKFNDDGSIKEGYSGQDAPPPSDEPDAKGGEPPIVRGVSGEAVAILKRPDKETLKKDLKALYDKGIRALAVILIHSFTFPDHERVVEEVAKEVGFEHISLSSELMPMIKVSPRRSRYVISSCRSALTLLMVLELSSIGRAER
jgi:5-oxoprolinase (ATP-hydrolysing)